MGIIKFIVKMVVGFFLVVLLLGVLLSAMGSVKAATFSPDTVEGLQCTYLIENYSTGKKSPKAIILHVNDFDHVQSYDKTIQLVNETTGKQITVDHLMRSSLTLFDESMNEIASVVNRSLRVARKTLKRFPRLASVRLMFSTQTVNASGALRNTLTPSKRRG